jgi:hypothetical protein
LLNDAHVTTTVLDTILVVNRLTKHALLTLGDTRKLINAWVEGGTPIFIPGVSQHLNIRCIHVVRGSLRWRLNHDLKEKGYV